MLDALGDILGIEPSDCFPKEPGHFTVAFSVDNDNVSAALTKKEESFVVNYFSLGIGKFCTIECRTSCYDL